MIVIVIGDLERRKKSKMCNQWIAFSSTLLLSDLQFMLLGREPPGTQVARSLVQCTMYMGIVYLLYSLNAMKLNLNLLDSFIAHSMAEGARISPP